MWTHPGLNRGPFTCEAKIIPLDHVPAYVGFGCSDYYRGTSHAQLNRTSRPLSIVTLAPESGSGLGDGCLRLSIPMSVVAASSDYPSQLSS